MLKKLSIVILNYNKKEFLKNCLESIFQNSKLNAKSRKLICEIIVVDNASTDGSKEYLKSLESRGVEYRNKKKQNNLNSKLQTLNPIPLRVLFNDRNLGFTGGNNVGIKYALDNGADYIMLLNNDVIVKDAFWQSMIKYMENNKEAGIMAPKIYFAPGYEFHKDRYLKEERGKVIWYAGGKIDWDNVITSHRGVDEVDHGQYGQIEETQFITGCCLLARKEIWQEVGLLDDKYYLYFEDADFSLRAQKAGWKTIFFPQANIWHMNAGSSQVGGKLQDYYNSRNRMLFGMRWAPLRPKIALIRESIKLLFKGRKWQRIGIKDYYLGRFGKGSWK